MRAVLLGHQRVAAGLGIGVPILVLASARTEFARRWHEGLRVVDSVLDVEQTAARAVRLGPHVTVVRVDGAIHDVLCSRKDVRERAFGEITRWLGYALP